jgi:type I restriction enzyme S subunit
VTLDEIAEVQGGIQKQQKRRPVENKYPFLRVANVSSGALNLQDVHEVELFEGELDRFSLRPGDLLVVEGNGSVSQLGRAARWNGEIENCVHQNHLIRVRPGPAVLARFLELVWNSPSISEQLRRVAASTSGLHTLSTAKLKGVSIALPPLKEQRHIVAVLEEQLPRLDAAGSNAARAIASAAAMIRSIKAQAVRDLVSRFPSAVLADEIREPLRNGHSARAVAEGTIRTLTLTAVTRGVFDDVHTKMTAADPARVAKLWLKQGDILIQRSNTPDLVGTSAVYEGPEDWAIFPDLLIRVRTSDRLDPQFAQLVLSAPQTRQYYRSHAKGLAGSMPKIDQETILNTRIPLPDLNVQRQTVQEVMQVIERAMHATATAEAYRGKSAALRRSLLADAFAGRLVAQDPADEPADATLARIRAEREAAGAVKSRRRSPRRAPAQRRSAPEAPPAPREDASDLATATQPTLDLEMPS